MLKTKSTINGILGVKKLLFLLKKPKVKDIIYEAEMYDEGGNENLNNASGCTGGAKT